MASKLSFKAFLSRSLGVKLMQLLLDFDVAHLCSQSHFKITIQECPTLSRDSDVKL